MTDARLPERYLNDKRIVRLSPEDFQGYVLSMLWSVANRTDGLIEREDLFLLPSVRPDAPARYVARELWAPVETGWIIVDFSNTQTSAHDLDVLDNVRRAGREKKARQRAAKAGLELASPPAFQDVPGDSTGGTYPGTSRGRVPEDSTGEERTGRDYETKYDERTGEISDLAQQAMSAWESGKSCRVCGKSLPAASPLTVCGVQDDAHNFARSNRSNAA